MDHRKTEVLCDPRYGKIILHCLAINDIVMKSTKFHCYNYYLFELNGGAFMGVQFEEYLKTIKNESTRKLLQTSYKVIGDYEDSTQTLNDVKRIFYAARVKTPQSARNFCAQFRNFARYIQDNTLILMLDSFGTNEFLEISLKVMELGAAKYFSNEKFNTAYHSINNSHVLNPFYTQTLFRCIYEGIYSRDFSVLINLCASDIRGNIVTCHPKCGSAYDIEISDALANNLRILSETHSWMCRNGYNEFPRDISGEHPDSCFKVENPRQRENRRSPLEDRYINTYRTRLREIVSTELGYNVSAYDIYVSGIMYRISIKLSAQGFSVCDAFSKNNRNGVIKQIIEGELHKCNYKGTVSQFKRLVEGHLELFEIPTNQPVISPQTFLIPDKKRVVDETMQDVLECINLSVDDNRDIPLVKTGIQMPKQGLIPLGDRLIYPRNRAVAWTALVLANHHCEIDSEHPTFISKRYATPYTEPHHLIPIAYADNFDVSLDVPENVISLCSNCHNEIHYGRDNRNILRWLYENRKTQLESVGIIITFEDLLLMYNLG